MLKWGRNNKEEVLMKDLLVFKKLVERLNGGCNGTFLGGGAITMSR